MGGVALLLKEKGYAVTGSDERAYPPMSTILEEHGVHVIEGFDAGNLSPAPDLVVIGNAMSRGNAEVEAVLERKLRYVSLAETLKEFFIRGKTSLVVTGTHGKTTTSSLLAWVLERAGRNPGFMIGGVPENFGVGARDAGGALFVTEGDEYDTAFFDKRSKFVHYLPDYVIVNNIEFDHADIFASVEDIELSFARMLNLVPRNGLVVANADDSRVMTLTDGIWCKRITFGIENKADWRAENIANCSGGTSFRLIGPPGEHDCMMPLFGPHNAHNALAVATICSSLGLSMEQIADGFESFKGVRRRLQVVNPAGPIIYDDFAHHPTAIAETIRAVRAAHPRRRIWAIFEPRSNTTVRNIFQQELTSALSSADLIVIGAIYRADKIAAEDRLDVDGLVRSLRSCGSDAWHVPAADDIISLVTREARPDDVIILMSNGAFSGLSRTLPAATSTISASS